MSKNALFRGNKSFFVPSKTKDKTNQNKKEQIKRV